MSKDKKKQFKKICDSRAQKKDISFLSSIADVQPLLQLRPIFTNVRIWSAAKRRAQISENFSQWKKFEAGQRFCAKEEGKGVWERCVNGCLKQGCHLVFLKLSARNNMICSFFLISKKKEYIVIIFTIIYEIMLLNLVICHSYWPFWPFFISENLSFLRLFFFLSNWPFLYLAILVWKGVEDCEWESPIDENSLRREWKRIPRKLTFQFSFVRPKKIVFPKIEKNTVTINPTKDHVTHHEYSQTRL